MSQKIKLSKKDLEEEIDRLVKKLIERNEHIDNLQYQIETLRKNGKQVADAFWIERVKYDEVVDKLAEAEKALIDQIEAWKNGNYYDCYVIAKEALAKIRGELK